MIYQIAADILVVLHLCFVGFVVGGAFLALKWRWVLYIQMPAAVWGALIEFRGWLCPLTPLEQYLRQEAGQVGYGGGFIENYILPILYPLEITWQVRTVLGTVVVVINVVVYSTMVVNYLQQRKREK